MFLFNFPFFLFTGLRSRSKDHWGWRHKNGSSSRRAARAERVKHVLPQQTNLAVAVGEAAPGRAAAYVLQAF